MKNSRLLDAVTAITRLVESPVFAEDKILKSAGEIMASLVAKDDWLPDVLAKPHPEYYRQYLLYGDPLERFSLVSFVWGPGQKTPIHDHTVWGIIAMLRGAELEQHYRRTDGCIEPTGAESRLNPGEIACVSPNIGDIHRVSNAHEDQVSISIHLYGGNIGQVQRSVYDAKTGAPKEFVSGYSNDMTPNLWTYGT